MMKSMALIVALTASLGALSTIAMPTQAEARTHFFFGPRFEDRQFFIHRSPRLCENRFGEFVRCRFEHHH